MTYEELVEKVKKTYDGADASKVEEHVAIQFNIEGEAQGAFYLEVADGKVNVEPYEYYDKDVLAITSAQTLVDVAEGKTDIKKAYVSGALKAEGNLGKALLLEKIVLKKAEPAKKTTAKKETAKKEATKKEAAPKKCASKCKTTKAADKAETKTTTKKTTAKKTTKKAEEK